MKREIKFRGKRTDGKGWVYGYYYATRKNTDDEINIHKIVYDLNGDSLVTNVIPETVGQFTGLTDKNGKDVFEGDMLSDGEKDPMILPVIYSDEYAMFCVDISFNKDGGAIEDVLTCYEDGFTVAGNIYDNPEMLTP